MLTDKPYLLTVNQYTSFTVGIIVHNIDHLQGS